MKLFLAIHTRTKDNQRGHWSKRAAVSRTERQAAYLMVAARKDRPQFPCRVTLTRCGPRRLDVTNLGSAFKAIIDGISDAYGVDDRDERWTWVMAQRKQSMYGVEIQIESI